MRTIRSRSYRRMAWKNGGGETIEIAISPADASLDAFDWRVSMARVEAPGPFSIFPQVDRTLAVLDGGGITLRLPHEEVHLNLNSEPYAFSADLPVDALLLDGAITDLNVMSRRGVVRHRLRRVSAAGPTTLYRDADVMLVLAQGGPVNVEADGAVCALTAGDTVLWDGPGRGDMAVIPTSSAVTLYVVEFWR